MGVNKRWGLGMMGLAAGWLALELGHAAEPFRVATYNLESYVVKAGGERPVKSAASRAKIRESLHHIRADVLALQEVGGPEALEDLRAALKAEGLEYAHAECVGGWDTNIQVAVLSRFPIVERRSMTNATYLHQGRRFHVSRGFGEVEIQVNPGYRFVLLTAHLKSKRVTAEADEGEMRLQEAQLLRGRIEALLAADPAVNLAILGDFNDTKDSPTLRALIGRAARRPGLVDTRPAERNGDSAPNALAYFDPRHVTWTHYYGKEDTYSRIDYILLSRGMAREWLRPGTYVLSLANWGIGSDHRPLVAEFLAEDR